MTDSWAWFREQPPLKRLVVAVVVLWAVAAVLVLLSAIIIALSGGLTAG